MKRISLTALIQKSGKDNYLEQYEYIIERIKQEKIKPVKASALNGKHPALHESYWIIEQNKNYDNLIEELNYKLPTAISTDYYIQKPSVYEEERKWVLLLAKFIEQTSHVAEPTKVSVNERSFQIWSREKFLQKEQGRKILSHCGITLEQLHVYQTTEPLAYYSSNRQVPQTILIIENKDTFSTMRRFLIENENQLPAILGEKIQTLVYGAGKGILRSIEDFRFCVEPYMNDDRNTYLYFGDLDYEGIGIYERLAELFRSEHELIPFITAYEIMMRKAESWDTLPITKTGQNRNLSGKFFTYFEDDFSRKMKELLKQDKYIPQEIINILDF